jgi:Uma2 family endonuclease
MNVALEPNRKMPPRSERVYTGDDLLRHPEWGPCELIRGKVKRVPWSNFEQGEMMTEICRLMLNFAAERKLGSVVAGGSGVYLERDPDTVRGPDVYFISSAREPAKEDRAKYLHVAPELCVEIVSPKDRFSKTMDKINMYLAIGVKLVWVIDPQSRTAQIYRGGNSVSNLGTGGVLSGEDVLPGFELALNDLFAVLD